MERAKKWAMWSALAVLIGGVLYAITLLFFMLVGIISEL